MIVRLGSTNSMKVRATERAFHLYFKKARVVPIEVKSSVSPQPISLGEIVRGARERARVAMGESNFSVGIEAGIFRVPTISPRAFQITVACVTNGREEAIGGSPFLELPEEAVRAIQESEPVLGVIGRLTRRKVTREEATRLAVIMALSPFLYTSRGHSLSL